LKIIISIIFIITLTFNNMHELFDIGINHHSKQYKGILKQVFQNAFKANVTRILLIGCDEKDSIEASDIAREYSNRLYSTAGVHPHAAKTCTSHTYNTLRNLLKNAWVKAVGECGLDFDRNFSPRDVQEHVFAEHIKIAHEIKKPIYLHCRGDGAHEQFIKMLSKYPDVCKNAVVHCFTGTKEQLLECLSLGMHVGITGWICDERRGLDLQKIVKIIPRDKLMIETDAPWLLPRNIPKSVYKGQVNEPMYLTYVLEKVAECRGETKEDVAKYTTENALRFFNITNIKQQSSSDIKAIWKETDFPTLC
jgi:TatD DNase family protein